MTRKEKWLLLSLIVFVGILVIQDGFSVAQSTTSCDWIYDKAMAATIAMDQSRGLGGEYGAERAAKASAFSVLYLACKERVK